MPQEPEQQPTLERADPDVPPGATAWLLTITAEAEVIPGDPKDPEE